MDGMIILTPWKCPMLADILQCKSAVLEDGVRKCPRGFICCCYGCRFNEDCCDRCEHLTVDEGHIKEHAG